VIYVFFAGKTVRENVGCFCQPLDTSSYVSIIISTFGEFAGLLLTSLFPFRKSLTLWILCCGLWNDCTSLIGCAGAL